MSHRSRHRGGGSGCNPARNGRVQGKKSSGKIESGARQSNDAAVEWAEDRRRGIAEQKEPAPRFLEARVLSGGEGIRTPVRLSIPPGVYVRILLFLSPRPFVGQQKASHEPAM